VPLRGDRYTGIARRGFATITALALLSFVATALATLTLTFAADARRTARESTDAQLRQLIIAGAAQVRQFTERDEPQTGPKAIPLPPSLIADGGELILHFNPANKKVVARIGAKFRYVRASIDVEQ
jgi:type II secretory pathway component PulK